MVVRVRDKGQVTLPSSIRESLKLSKDAVLSVAKVGDAILLTPQPSTFETVADRFSSRAKKKGITLEGLLEDLRKLRHHQSAA